MDGWLKKIHGIHIMDGWIDARMDEWLGLGWVGQLKHLCPEVVEVPWQGWPLQVWIGLPHIRVVGIVRRVVVVLARKVQVVCNSIVSDSELFTVLWGV